MMWGKVDGEGEGTALCGNWWHELETVEVVRSLADDEWE